MLDPFPRNQFSSLVDSIGNPELKPEFVDAFELSYALTQENYKTDLSLYHHNIKDVIQWDDDIDTVTYNNSGQGSLNGVDIMLKVVSPGIHYIGAYFTRCFCSRRKPASRSGRVKRPLKLSESGSLWNRMGCRWICDGGV